MGASDSDEERVGEEGNDEAEDDAVVESEVDESVEDTDEEEEDVAYYEQDGFVVGEEDEEIDVDVSPKVSSGNKNRKRVSKKHKRKTEDFQLDEEDYSWMKEDVEDRRKTGRRLMRGDYELAARLDQPRNRLTQTFEELEDFHDDDDDGSLPDDGHGFPESSNAYGAGEHHEMDDFIVDEQLETRKKNQGSRQMSRRMTTAYSEAVGEVAEIFGDAEELIAMFEEAQQRLRAAREMKSDTIGEGVEDEMNLDQSMHKRLDEIDPEALAIHGLRPEDDLIRRTDMPERFQSRMGPAPESMEYDLAAEWIYEQLFGDGVETLESEIVKDGRLEIDGPSVDVDYNDKDPDHLCKGQRVVRKVRTIEQQEQWKQERNAQKNLKKSIENVLKSVYEELEEVPYIATYRKKLCGELLCMEIEEVPSWISQEEYDKSKDGKFCSPPGSVHARSTTMKRWHVLWAVYELSLKWRRMRLRVENRIKAFTQNQNEYSNEGETVYTIQKIIDRMKIAGSPEEIDLVNKRHKLVMASLGKQIPQQTVNLDSNVERYCMYGKMGYRKVVLGMGLRTGLLLDSEGMNSRSRQSCFKMDLQEVVAEIMEQNQGSVGLDTVLYGAQHVAAFELSTHPVVRKMVQEQYLKYATVTTTPTDVGEKVLDPFHAYGCVKRLVEKPVHTFKGDFFLRIIAASKAGYLTFKIGISEQNFQNTVLPVLHKSLIETERGQFYEGWKDFQNDVIKHLSQRLLFPVFEKEVIENLSEKARTNVLHKISENLWKIAIQAPFRPPVSENDYEDEDSLVRVCACCWGPGGKGQPSTVLVMLDSHGELKDMIELKQFSGYLETADGQDGEEQPDVLQDEKKKEDAQQIREFLMEHKPHVVVIGGAHNVCRQLVKDLELIRDHFLTEHSRFMVSIQGNMEVFLMSETLPAMWENSLAAKSELPDHSPHVRRAVAIGRCLIDPLSVLSSLRDHSNTILSLHLSDLQEMIIQEERLAKIDEVLVTAINQIGCELNLTSNVQWRSHSLQFVSGLGRQKAKGLLNVMHRNSNRIESRADLMTYTTLGTHTLKNAIGFLIVNGSELPGMANMDFDHLDETRIHFDYYNIARDLAIVATRNQDPEAALIELFGSPDLVQALNLDLFNKQGIETGREDMLSLIIDMQMEFLFPFYDRRPSFTKPQELEVFYMLLNETAESMRPGKMVEAVVEWTEENEIHCSLVQSRLKGVIKKEQFSSTEDPQSLDLRYKARRGDVLLTRLIGIAYEDCQVELTCRQADLSNEERWENEYCTDEYYHVKSREEKEQDRMAKEAKQEKSFVPRRIDHPLFKNMSQTECIKNLAKCSLGHAILRPSSEGVHCITLSFNTFTGKHGDIYLHRNISEGSKGPSQGDMLRLGLPLTLMLTSSRSIQFDDLDEVIPCFVDPFIDRMRSLTSHRKFKDGYGDEIDRALKEEKRKVGARGAVYCLSVDYLRPGLFYIASIWNQRVHREYFSLVPDGYYYRKQIFKDLERVTEEFKRNPKPPTYVPPETVGNETQDGAGGPPQLSVGEGNNLSQPYGSSGSGWQAPNQNANNHGDDSDSSDDNMHF